ncbi:putative aspartate aminotransferase [Diplonema papillatum]|nr:putative aspartate aminotransferase [Diplonema papillatum]
MDGGVVALIVIGGVVACALASFIVFRCWCSGNRAQCDGTGDIVEDELDCIESGRCGRNEECVGQSLPPLARLDDGSEGDKEYKGSDENEEVAWSPMEATRTPSVYSCRSYNTALNESGKRGSMTPVDTKQFHSASPAYPQCAKSVMHDWGPGLKSCASCGARPIWNRGCLACNQRMCATCFEAHKNMKVTTLQLAKAAISKYDNAGRGSLIFDEFNLLLRDLRIPQQTEDEFDATCEARGSDPKELGISLEHLVVLVSFLTPNCTEALATVAQQTKADRTPGPMCSIAGVKLHDFGPGLATCGSCGARPILNRGCPGCLMRLCPKCYPRHAQVGKLYKAFGDEEKAEKVPAPTLEHLKAEPHLSTDTVASPTGSKTADGPHISPPQPGLGHELPDACHARIVNHFALLHDRAVDDHLAKGGCYYYFTFLRGTQLSATTLRMSKILMHLSSFENEEKQNNVPPIDPESPADQAAYIFMLNKAVYMLPGIVSLSQLDVATMSSPKYHSKCQPAGSKILETEEKDTFRFAKTIVWPVYKLTMQFKVSLVDRSHYPELSELTDGLPVHHALLLERTKRNVQAVDIIRTAKSILLYHQVPQGGIIVTNITTAAATSVPSIVASIVDKLGSMGAKDVVDTALRTRKYFHENQPPKPVVVP